MTRRTSVWTDLSLMAAAGLVLSVGLAYAAVAASAAHPALVLVAAAVVATLSTRTDAFGGAAVGLFASAGVFAAQLALSGLPTDGAGPWALLASLLLMIGAVGGAIGDRVRREGRRSERAGSLAVAPAAGSLGLIGEADGRLRLAEEITRARLFGRPLSAARVMVEISDESLPRAESRRVRRAIARVLESVLRETDVPYALQDGGFGVVLPETAPDAAADVVGSVLIAAAQSTFTDRVTGSRRRVGDVVRLQLAVVDASAVASENSRAVIAEAGATLRHFDPAVEMALR